MKMIKFHKSLRRDILEAFGNTVAKNGKVYKTDGSLRRDYDGKHVLARKFTCIYKGEYYQDDIVSTIHLANRMREDKRS